MNRPLQPHISGTVNMILQWLKKAREKRIAEFNPTTRSYLIHKMEIFSNMIEAEYRLTITDRMLIRHLNTPP